MLNWWGNKTGGIKKRQSKHSTQKLPEITSGTTSLSLGGNSENSPIDLSFKKKKSNWPGIFTKPRPIRGQSDIQSILDVKIALDK